MKYTKFAIYDNKADAFLPDWNALNVPTGIRLFQEACLAPDSPYAKHPGDYALMEIGTVDNITAELTNVSPNIDHGSARQHLSRAMLEQDFNYPRDPAEEAGVQTFAELTKGTKDMGLLESITNGDALRNIQTKETTPS